MGCVLGFLGVLLVVKEVKILWCNERLVEVGDGYKDIKEGEVWRWWRGVKKVWEIGRFGGNKIFSNSKFNRISIDSWRSKNNMKLKFLRI